MKIDFKIDKKKFKREYQERRPHLMKNAAHVQDIMWEDISDIISRCDPQSENFRITSPKGNLPKEFYVHTYFHVGDLRRVLNKTAFYKYLHEGSTVVANHIYDEPVFNAYAKEIAQFTDRQTVTSAYIAFGNVDSYKAHWDSRDVFAVQIKGRKRWTVYEPSFEAPLYMHQSKYIEDKYPCPQDPCLDFILEEGDVFYIPRGWWHNVSPLGEPTVHLAIGTFPAFAVDYIRWIFRELPEILDARKALENFDEDAKTLESLGAHILKKLNDPNSYQEFMEAHLENQIIETRLNLRKLGDPGGKALKNNDKLRFNTLRSDISSEFFITGDGKIYFSDEIRMVCNFLTEHPEIEFSELLKKFPMMPEKQLSDLLHQLALHGAIEIL